MHVDTVRGVRAVRAAFFAIRYPVAFFPYRSMRADLEKIVEWMPDGSRVLDLGCGEGELLALLKERKHVRGVGLELSLECVQACISRGVSAYQGDLDQGLADLKSHSYDYVVLNQTLQMTRHPRMVMQEALRVGRRVIVGIPNFGYWVVRLQVLKGRTPRTRNLPYAWYNTPNFHYISANDFREYVRESGLHLLREAHFLGEKRVPFAPNLLATSSLFEIESNGELHG